MRKMTMTAMTAILGTGLMLAPAFAQESELSHNDKSQSYADIETSAGSITQLSLNQAQERIGTQVKGADGSKVGEIEDFVMGEDDQIRALVVELQENFGGQGSKMVKIDATQVAMAQDHVRLSMTSDQLRDLPDFNAEEDLQQNMTLASKQMKDKKRSSY